MAEDVIVKVRAKRAGGFIRAGVRWPGSDTYQRVSEDQAKLLESEPMLSVSRVGEGEVPPDQQAALASSAEGDKNPAQQRAEIVDTEFPQLAGTPGGQQVYVGTQDKSVGLAEGYRTQPDPGEKVDPLKQEPIEPGPGGEQPPIPQGTQPPQQDEPENQVVDLAANAFANDPLLTAAAEQTHNKKKRGQ